MRLSWAESETLAAVLADPSAPSKQYARTLSVGKRTVDWRLNALYKRFAIDGAKVGKKRRLLEVVER